MAEDPIPDIRSFGSGNRAAEEDRLEGIEVLGDWSGAQAAGPALDRPVESAEGWAEVWAAVGRAAPVPWPEAARARAFVAEQQSTGGFRVLAAAEAAGVALRLAPPAPGRPVTMALTRPWRVVLYR
ncbi:MAG: hypothetical protein ACFBSD_04275 [Paracoccaceae bacterium]